MNEIVHSFSARKIVNELGRLFVIIKEWKVCGGLTRLAGQNLASLRALISRLIEF